MLLSGTNETRMIATEYRHGRRGRLARESGLLLAAAVSTAGR